MAKIMKNNSLIPEEYDFEGVGIHESLTFQARINERIETLREIQETKQVLAVIDELQILSLAIDNHISADVKRQETDRARKQIHDSVNREKFNEITKDPQNQENIG
jgi:hypothetical protein